MCSKYLASHLNRFSSLRNLALGNLGFRNPVPRQEEKNLGSHLEKFELPPTKSLLKVQIKRLNVTMDYRFVPFG